MVSSLQSGNNLLKSELDRHNQEIDALEIKADFYRRQVVLESRFGMILVSYFPVVQFTIVSRIITLRVNKIKIYTLNDRKLK